MSNRRYRLSVDVGGTFTDVVLFDEKTKEVYITKVSSTPKDQSEGVIKGIKKIIKQAGVSSYKDISYFIHGTTVATNALLERRGAKTALITTEGFRDVFEIGRQRRPDLYSFWAKRPKPPIPRYLIFEVPERVLYNGEVVKKLDENKAKQIIKEVKRYDVKSIAVCFLHSYKNSVNERRMKEIILEEMPEAYVSISCEILPEIREYERTCTTAVNAYLMPKVQVYINNLVKRKENLGITAKLHVMQSNGGVMNADVAAKRSVHTVFSGPAGGVLAGVYMSKLVGEDNVITLDMGGTSTDLALIERSQIRLTTEGEIGGFPIKVPMIEMHTIGAGGGSIAWVDAGGALRVGPQSAGADPGPACYGLGGENPTVTDANLVLRRLSEENFLGGEKLLSYEKAKLAIEKKLSSKLNLPLIECASGIINVVNSNMSGGVSVISTQKGYDLREFSLIAFGGAAPLHAAQLADGLKMKKVIIPLSPGNFSAIGGQLAEIRYDYVRTNVKSVNDITASEYNEIWKEMRKEAISHLAEEGFAENEIIFAGTADMRYAGQAWELIVPVPIESPSERNFQKIARDFQEIHKRTYGYILKDEDIIFVNFRLSAVGPIPKLEFKEEPLRDNASRKALKGNRDVFIDGNFVKCSIYDREKLVPGSLVIGPAIIEEYASTTLIPSKKMAKIDKFRNIIIEEV
ncbi:hydantoinase/oxoprolinase family protein [Candidatus Aerophobetes bacterium]|uniref:Hydantoinase/oxoprolinase family protein n=1 Tax=Aerophobetes bacterium TaxID=2030807 RepID=A0A662DMC7_UNCAE|nr:MAG: hydantoinase/oxoprolinase family protein [Candidatus Aerophobetes bacterium]